MATIYSHLNLEQRRRFLAAAIAITTICAQFTTLLMAQPELNAPKAAHAQWNDEETAALVDFMHDHASEGEGGGNFKPQVYTSAAESINHNAMLQALPSRKGPPKTMKMVKTKWTTVRH